MGRRLRDFSVLLLVLVVGFVLLFGMDWGAGPSAQLRDYLVRNATQQTGSINLVSSIYLGYRDFDTLGETIVMLVAVLGVATILRHRVESERNDLPQARMPSSEIVDLISRKLIPYVLLFGFYLVTYGHLSPGGGFQGGVVLSTGLVMLALSRGVAGARRLFPARTLNAVETGAFLTFLLAGTIGIITGPAFLGNFLPIGRAGEVPSAGFIFLLNIVIGLKVGSGMTLICFSTMAEH